MELDFLDEDFLEQVTKTVQAGSKFRPKPKLAPKSTSKPSLIHTIEPQIKDGKNTCTDRVNSDENDDLRHSVSHLSLEASWMSVGVGDSVIPGSSVHENLRKEVECWTGDDNDIFPSIQSAGLDLHHPPTVSSVEVLGEKSLGCTFPSCFSGKTISNKHCEPSTITMPASDDTNSLDGHMDDEQFNKHDGTSYHGLNSLSSNAFEQELATDNEIGEFGTEVRYSVPTGNDFSSTPHDSERANSSEVADPNFLETEDFEDLGQYSTNATVDVWPSYDPSAIDSFNDLEMQGSEPRLDESHPEKPTVADEFSETIRESNFAASSDRQSKRVTFADVDGECEIGKENSSAFVEEEQSQETDEVFGAYDENTTCELPKRTRKRGPDVYIDENENFNTEEIEDDVADDPLYSMGGDINKKKNTKKRRIPGAGSDIQDHGGKKQPAGNSSASKDQVKKKFSHSTRRSRKIDPRIKELLEMPEEDVDPKKLMMKDLILLAKLKEKKMGKEATASKTSTTNIRSGGSFNGDSPYDEDGNDFHTEGQNSDEEARTEPTSFKLNYHSFMAKTPRERWSAPQTQLFYEAVRQFGSDFAMIQQMFPGRSRRQIKLKYKAEERKHPSQMADALMHRSEDRSHFELVLERVKAAQAERQANAWSDSPFPDDEEEGEEGNCNEGADISGEGNGEAKEATASEDLENNVDSVGKEDEIDEDYDWNNYTSFDTYYSDPKESLDT